MPEKSEHTKRLKGVETINVGGPANDSRASLCIYSDDIDIDTISRLLECEPTKAHRRGDMVGKSKTTPAKIGLWSLDAPSELSFENKLGYLISSTTPKRKAWDELATNHKIWLRCAIFLHSWTEGFGLPAKLIAEIGHRHWEFGLSMYSAEGNEIVDAFLKPSQYGSNKKPTA